MNQSRAAVVSWCVYDWAMSSFSIIITTFIFAAYFTSHIAPNSLIGTHLWGNAASISGLCIAVLSPVFGAIADHYRRRKIWLGCLSLIAVIGAALLWFAKPSSASIYFTLICVVIGTVGLEIATVFYNSMLPGLVAKKYIGRISGWAWGLGYAGGLICLIIALVFFVEGNVSWLDKTTAENVRICGPLVSVWFFIFAIPLFIFWKEPEHIRETIGSSLKRGLRELKHTIKTLPKQPDIFRYLIAHMIYVDGLNTIFAFGGIYAAGTFGMGIDEVIKFGIAMNVSAGFGAALFAWVDDWIGPKKTIVISLTFAAIFSIILLIVHDKSLFWLFALCLSLFFGPIQAASRSLMAHIVPPERETELFGLYALSGRVTTFIGPWLLGTATLIFASQRVGMATVLIFFVLGGILLCSVKAPQK
ncbi:MAG: MFS transporter [Gammaproteobacteria bacterium]